MEVSDTGAHVLSQNGAMSISNANSFVERRRDRRLELAFPIEYSSAEPSATLFRAALTRNVSSGGVYFITDTEPHLSIGASVRIRMAVPQRHDTGGPPLALHGEGRILRIERLAPRQGQPAASQPRWGIAVAFSAKPTVRTSGVIEYLMSEAGTVQPPSPHLQPPSPPAHLDSPNDG